MHLGDGTSDLGLVQKDDACEGTPDLLLTTSLLRFVREDACAGFFLHVVRSEHAGKGTLDLRFVQKVDASEGTPDLLLATSFLRFVCEDTFAGFFLHVVWAMV